MPSSLSDYFRTLSPKPRLSKLFRMKGKPNASTRPPLLQESITCDTAPASSLEEPFLPTTTNTTECTEEPRDVVDVCKPVEDTVSTVSTDKAPATGKTDALQRQHDSDPRTRTGPPETPSACDSFADSMDTPSHRVDETEETTIPGHLFFGSQPIHRTIDTWVASGHADYRYPNPEMLSLDTIIATHFVPLNKPPPALEMNSPSMPTTVEEPDLATENPFDVLLQYRSNSRNIIDESCHPNTVPHIVITTVEETYESQWISFENRPPIQLPPHLPVPPLGWNGLMAIPITTGGRLYPPWPMPPPPPVEYYPEYVSEVEFEDTAGVPTPVQEKVWCELNTLDARHTMQLVADHASKAAAAFRCRWDEVPEIMDVERPYEWNDPAEALFQSFRTPSMGYHFIPSPNPFRSPHICIQLAPPQDYSVIENNRGPKQDCETGNALVVPELTWGFRTYFEEPETHPDLTFYSLQEEGHETDFSCDSSLPATPTSVRRTLHDELGMLCRPEINAYDLCTSPDLLASSSSEDTSESEPSPPSPTIDLPATRSPKARFFIEEEQPTFEDDDDDDGAPLPIEDDPWFRETAARSPAVANLLGY